MNSIDLWDSFGGLDADLIERSQQPQRIIPWKAISAAAACLALAVLCLPIVYMTLFAAGKSASSEDSKDFGQEFAYQNSAESSDGMTEAAESAEILLVINDPAGVDVPYFEYEPLPGDFTREPMSLDELATISPNISPARGERVVDSEGRTVRTVLEFPEGTVYGIEVSMAESFAAADAAPLYRPDAPGNAELSHVGDTDVLVIGTPIRAPGGTAWKLTAVFQKQFAYELTTTTTPAHTDESLLAIQTLIQALP